MCCKLADTECQISEIDNNNYRQERSPYIPAIKKSSGKWDLTKTLRKGSTVLQAF